MTSNLPRLPSSFAGRLGVLVAFWACFTLLLVGHAYITLVYVVGTEYRMGYGISGAVQGLSWIFVTPLVVAMVTRFPLAGQRWVRSIALHFATAGLVAVAVTVVVILALAPFDMGARAPEGWSAFPSVYTRVFLLFEIVWFAVAASATAVAATRLATAQERRAAEREHELSEREVRAALLRARTAQLEGQLSAAQLDALRMQLNPHFLFNTLHAVSTLMGRDVDGARTMISNLSGLLRRVLDGSDAPEVPLDDELDLLGRYLDIERARFADRLDVNMCVDDATRSALVPTLILQPLVENAIKHGIAPRGKGGRVEVAARRLNGHLVVHICDDGPGLPPGGPPREGVGLRNTRDRLEKIYGDDARLTLRNRPEGGLDAEVRIPFTVA